MGYTTCMQTVVGVLRGGPSREHEVSLQTGATILAHLSPEQYLARDIYIDRKGVWHERGRPVSPERVLRQLDVVLIGLHGDYGETGEVQKLLDQFGVPYAGADHLGSHFAMHKLLSKARAEELGLLTPSALFVERVEDADEVAREGVRKFHQPVVVKPLNWGSSIGVSLVGGYAEIVRAIEQLFAEGAKAVLIEDYIRGKEATVGVIERFRNEALYALPPVEIETDEREVFAFTDKYSGDTREYCPGRFSRVETEDLMRAAKVMHRALGLRHYSRSDFRVSPRGIYYLETNTLPGLTDESLMPRALASVGETLPHFLSHLVNLALTR